MENKTTEFTVLLQKNDFFIYHILLIPEVLMPTVQATVTEDSITIQENFPEDLKKSIGYDEEWRFLKIFDQPEKSIGQLADTFITSLLNYLIRDSNNQFICRVVIETPASQLLEAAIKKELFRLTKVSLGNSNLFSQLLNLKEVYHAEFLPKSPFEEPLDFSEITYIREHFTDELLFEELLRCKYAEKTLLQLLQLPPELQKSLAELMSVRPYYSKAGIHYLDFTALFLANLEKLFRGNPQIFRQDLIKENLAKTNLFLQLMSSPQ
ncbi:hypothetical protein ACYSNU_07485 [Enterococcus sp. LJL120]